MAAFGARRFLRGARLVGSERTRTLHDPDAILAIDRDPGDLPDQPLVRQRLGPIGIDLEIRCVRDALVGRSFGIGGNGRIGAEQQQGEALCEQALEHGDLLL
jgi:hypothetical protein